MRIAIGLIALFAMAQNSPRPVIEVPGNLTADYFRQAYIIEAASARQVHTIEQMAAYCSDNKGTLQKSRDKDDQLVFLCIPKDDKK